MDRVRVLRIIEYEGPRDWVERTVARSIKEQVIQGAGSAEGPNLGGKCVIRGATLGTYPEILRPSGEEGLPHVS